MHARAKWLKTRSTGGGISGGGREGGDQKPSLRQTYIAINIKGQSLGSGCPLLEVWNSTTLQ